MVDPVHPEDSTRRDYAHSRGLDIISERTRWFMGLGIGLVVIGVLAVIAAFTATLATVVVFGLLFLIAGVVQLADTFSARAWSGFFLHLAIGALYVVAGVLMVARPGASAVAVTLLLAAVFLVSGVMRIVVSLAERFPSWGWSLVNGIISAILGILIWAAWPASSFFVIGLFIGIELIATGVALMMLASVVHRERPGIHVEAR